MSERNNGGPAFPIRKLPYVLGLDGMSLRDWFAAQALIGVMTSPFINKVSGKVNLNEHDISAASYLIADAMLAERSK